MILNAKKQGAYILLSVGCLVVTACSSHNSTRYGGEIISKGCSPVAVPCQTAPVQYIPTQHYVVTPQLIAAPAPSLPAPAPVPAPAPAYVEPSVAPIPDSEPYVEPYVEPAPFIEPYRTPYRDLAPVDDELISGPLIDACPDGYIQGYGGGACIPIAIPRK